jgi:hypothetical protein
MGNTCPFCSKGYAMDQSIFSRYFVFQTNMKVVRKCKNMHEYVVDFDYAVYEVAGFYFRKEKLNPSYLHQQCI